MAVKFYVISSLLLCVYFVYCGSQGQLMIDFNHVSGVKPSGPGQHYHK